MKNLFGLYRYSPNTDKYIEYSQFVFWIFAFAPYAYMLINYKHHIFVDVYFLSKAFLFILAIYFVSKRRSYVFSILMANLQFFDFVFFVLNNLDTKLELPTLAYFDLVSIIYLLSLTRAFKLSNDHAIAKRLQSYKDELICR